MAKEGPLECKRNFAAPAVFWTAGAAFVVGPAASPFSARRGVKGSPLGGGFSG
ncbi:hypothetical protein GCWU000246_00378 [Jonquetella anthropi E3_33 E1]|nr:hypothetical protein GCWU000246_00378 [Jonquetella anthropi E3_33 E1]